MNTEGAIATKKIRKRREAIDALMKVEIGQGNIDEALDLQLQREKRLSAEEKYQLSCNYLAKEWSISASEEIECEEGESMIFLGGAEKVRKIIAEADLKHTVDAVLQFAIGENQILAAIDIAGKLGTSTAMIDSIVNILNGKNFLKRRKWSGVEMLESNNASDKAIEAIIKRAMVAGRASEVLRAVAFRKTEKGHNLTQDELEDFMAVLIINGNTRDVIKMANYRRPIPGLKTEEFEKLTKAKNNKIK